MKYETWVSSLNKHSLGQALFLFWVGEVRSHPIHPKHAESLSQTTINHYMSAHEYLQLHFYTWMNFLKKTLHKFVTLQ